MKKYESLQAKYAKVVDQLSARRAGDHGLVALARWSMHTTTSGIAVVRGGALSLVNDRFRALAGAGAGEPIGWRALVGHPRVGRSYADLKELAVSEAGALEAEQTFTAHYRRNDQRQTIEVRFERVPNLAGCDPYVVVVVHDVSERVRDESELLQTHLELAREHQVRLTREALAQQMQQLADQRSAFARQLINAQERERERIARELHDDLGQLLTALKLEARAVVARADDPAHVERGLQTMIGYLADALESVRTLARGLHPDVLAHIGLRAAIDSMCRRMAAAGRLECNVVTAEAIDSLPGEIALAAYRIAQEALTNVVRHANAARVWLTVLLRDGSLTITLDDDGRGSERHELGSGESMGVAGMRQRACVLGGDLVIGRGPRGGLRVQAGIPIPPAGQIVLAPRSPQARADG